MTTPVKSKHALYSFVLVSIQWDVGRKVGHARKDICRPKKPALVFWYPHSL